MKKICLVLFGMFFFSVTFAQNNNLIQIGNTYWSKYNYPSMKDNEPGRPLTYQDAMEKAPKGYRLPTEEEALNLIYSGEAYFGNSNYNFSSSSGSSIIFPFTETGKDYIGKYWVQGEKIIYFEFHWGLFANQWGIATERRLVRTEPEIRSENNTAHVKYVLDD